MDLLACSSFSHYKKSLSLREEFFFFPREKVPSALTVPPGTKFWLFFSYQGKSSLGAKILKTLISKLFFKSQYHSYCT